MYPSKQLADARNNLGIREVSGVCNDGDKFRDQINEVTEQLMIRGGWVGLEVLMRFCLTSCDVVFPRIVGTVIGARSCCGDMPIRNPWYEIAGSCSCPFYGTSMLRDNGFVPTYNKISGTTGKRVAYHVIHNDDIGRAITIYGTKAGGLPLQTKQADGTWVDGVTITAFSAGGAVLPAMTVDLVTNITSITREATSGMTFLYEYGPDKNGVNALRDLAQFQPNELRPQYRSMRISTWPGFTKRTDADGRVFSQLEIMAKLEFIPLVNEWDFLLIDSYSALRYGIQAYKKDVSGDAEGAESFWLKAIRDLNFTDRNKSPSNQLSVRVSFDTRHGCVLTNPV